MSRLRSRLVLLTCALAFLLAQLSGAHYHRHIGHVLHAEADITDLHFWDTGLQNGDAGAHGHYQEPAGHAVHSFIDLKIDATGDGLLKVFKSTLLAGLLFAVFLLWVAPRLPVRVRPIASTTRQPGPVPFYLRPPSHAPPASLLLA